LKNEPVYVLGFAASFQAVEASNLSTGQTFLFLDLRMKEKENDLRIHNPRIKNVWWEL
jgi:hypothetical protein